MTNVIISGLSLSVVSTFIVLLFWSGDLCVPTGPNSECSVDWPAFGSVLSGFAITVSAAIAAYGIYSWRLKAKFDGLLEALDIAHYAIASLAEGMSAATIEDEPSFFSIWPQEQYEVRRVIDQRSFASAAKFRQQMIGDAQVWNKLRTHSYKLQNLLSHQKSDELAKDLRELIALKDEILDRAFVLKALQEADSAGWRDTFESDVIDDEPELIESCVSIFPMQISNHRHSFERPHFIDTSNDFCRHKEYILEKVGGLTSLIHFGVVTSDGKTWIISKHRHLS